MNEDRYIAIENNSDYSTFTFFSEGRYGSLLKIVRFDLIPFRAKTYNLSLGTVVSTNEVDYNTITNNGDRNRVLATVALIIYIFLEKHPECKIYITGNDARRTILYQRAITYGYKELNQSLNIYGDISNEEQLFDFEVFDLTKNYNGFLIESR
jgi:hypothetical protein